MRNLSFFVEVDKLSIDSRKILEVTFIQISIRSDKKAVKEFLEELKEERKRVLCLSFHYAEKQMEFPYS